MMKGLWIPLLLGFVVASSVAIAQAPNAPASRASGAVGISAGEVAPTPDMWFYQQYLQQYQDPKTAVRHSAEYRAFQRQSRLAARQWYGLSNARPVAGCDPIHGDYSPGWTGRSHIYPFRWTAPGFAAVVVRPESRTTY